MKATHHIECLDGLRGLAAVLVVVSHIDHFFPVDNLLVRSDIGDEAVGVFFSLSGFLMAYLYGANPFRPVDFMVRRLARIYPVYFVAVLVTALLSVWPGSGYPAPFGSMLEFVRHVLMLGSAGVFWSIPPEIQFYFFFLLLWLLMLDPRKYAWVLVLTVLLLVAGMASGFAGPGILLFSKLPYFCFGALAGYVFLRTPVFLSTWWRDCMGLGLLLLYFSCRMLFLPETIYWGMTTGLGASVVVYMVATGGRLMRIAFANPPAVFAGKISFSVYLFHLPVLYLAQLLLPQSLPVFATLAIALIAVLLTSYASYLIIEAPCRKFLVDFWKAIRATGNGPSDKVRPETSG